jgi:hypothetical protein
MFCQLITRCYAPEQHPGMALRCQSSVTYVQFCACPLAMPDMAW